jgi:hypothetical protein
MEGCGKGQDEALVQPFDKNEYDTGRVSLGRLLQAIELIFPASTVDAVIKVINSHRASNAAVGLNVKSLPLPYSEASSLRPLEVHIYIFVRGGWGGGCFFTP